MFIGPPKAVEHADGQDSGDEIDAKDEVEVNRLKDANKEKSGTQKARPSSRSKWYNSYIQYVLNYAVG